MAMLALLVNMRMRIVLIARLVITGTIVKLGTTGTKIMVIVISAILKMGTMMMLIVSSVYIYM